MVSQPVINVIIGALLTGTFLIISNLLTNWNNDKREEKQRTWQLEREEQQRIWQLEREKQQRIWQDESDHKKWYREKIYDSYSKSIQLSTKIIQAQLEFDIELKKTGTVSEDKYTNINNLGIEFLSEFNIITINHPDKESEEFKENKNKIITATLEKNFEIALDIISQIKENDSRIKNINQ
jgi:hypothetical protein